MTRPTISPDGGTFSGVLVTLDTLTLGAEIRYTLDGSEPNQTSQLYREPFTLTTSTTVKVKAFKVMYASSEVVSATFTIL